MIDTKQSSCGQNCAGGADLGRGAEVEGRLTFHIAGADCSDEVTAIKKALAAIGIANASVNLVASTVNIAAAPGLENQKIRAAIESTGVRVLDVAPKAFAEVNRWRILLISGSGILLASGFLGEWLSKSPTLVTSVLFGLATLSSGLLVFPKAFRSALSRSFDMNLLMTIAVIGAFSIAQYSEAATVVFLFSVAELLESFSVARARQAIKTLLVLTPQSAQVIQNGVSRALPVGEVRVGDILSVRPGDRIPLDGLITEGESAINQAPLTGESVPVIRRLGDPVFAGTINGEGALKIQVRKPFRESRISRVIQLIEEAQEQKAPTERFVDKFAKVYTPIVFALAVLCALAPPLILNQSFEDWFYRALVLLVIACPCALVLATPISVVAGLAALARNGVLVKGGKHLEALGKITAVALDKTGTLTEGKFKVQDYRTFGRLNESEVLEIAVALEARSSHPLAKAILQYAPDDDKVPELEASDYVVVPGRGAEGTLCSGRYFVGNHRYAREAGVCNEAVEAYVRELERQTLSVVVVGEKPTANGAGGVLGIFGLGDRIRSNAADAIAELRKGGVKKVVVLSGDNQKAVDALCRQVGVDEGHGDLLPEDKVTRVKALNQEFIYVAMVGDGINDAPALASASLGISMGAAGTDTAIETSDVSLMQDDLSQLSKAIRHGRRALNVIRFNIAFAIAIKGVFLVLAVIGYSNLWFAVAADMGASMIVTLNAFRLMNSRAS